MRVLFVLMVVSLPFLSGCSPIWQKAESTPNAVNSVEQMRITAAQGKAEAQFNLGVMYKKGQGVPQDYAQAYMWVNLAAAQGVEDAVRMRDNLVKKLTASQIEEGQRLAREWIAKHPQAQVAQ